VKYRSDKIMVEGDPAENIFFLKEGEFEVYTKKSTKEIMMLINQLSGIENKFFEEMNWKGYNINFR
jgi:hypothetical protein